MSLINLPLVAIEYFTYKDREASYQAAVQQRYLIQDQEEQDRLANPPTAEELRRMQTEPRTCFHNADCRYRAKSLYDCNRRATNEFYCEAARASTEGSIFLDNACIQTEIGCGVDNYAICENQVCVSKKLPVLDPRYQAKLSGVSLVKSIKGLFDNL